MCLILYSGAAPGLPPASITPCQVFSLAALTLGALAQSSGRFSWADPDPCPRQTLTPNLCPQGSLLGNGERSLPDPRGSPCPQQGAARTLWDLELWSIQRFLESLRAGSCCSIPGLCPTAPLRGGNSSARPTGIWEKLPKEASSPSHPTGQSHTQDSVSRIKNPNSLQISHPEVLRVWS